MITVIETRASPADNDNKMRTPEGGGPMRIYIFKSDANKELRAFAGDSTGSKLPSHFRPWHAVGVISPERAPPHNFARLSRAGRCRRRVVDSRGCAIG